LIDLIRGQTVIVVGLARSGTAAAALLAEKGAARVIVTDSRPAADLQQQLTSLKQYGQVEAVTGENPPELAAPGVSMVIKSPGVPPGLEIFKRSAELQIPVLSEVELAYAFMKAPLIGVTGTNGKTTTTALLAEILAEARFNGVMAAGNIGVPLCEAVEQISAGGVVAAELSSFQLADILNFRPAVAVFLNFAEDHLDYHGSVENYYRAKARLFENQRESDFAVLNASDPAVSRLHKEVRAGLLWFARGPVERGAGIERGELTLFNRGRAVASICPVEELALPGEHNLENALAATAAAWAAGAKPQAIGRVLRSFKSIAHRLEFVAEIGGVEFINDSKGTNPGSVIKALRSFPGKKKILLAGGRDKGSDFSELAEVIKEEVHSLVLFGESRAKLARAVAGAGFTAYQQAATLDEAVAEAWSRARPGDMIILSPACTSWDAFTDYEARGNRFKELVYKLREKEGGV
ncbi:MAG: UDP-N-acetylmuramoyl-L-alanine--D-glutamate ligase, partial [Dethiobacteria bacterium]|jgi:UDP-N-acetylmuramoylalanine--D-glutamate ligase